MAGFGENDTVVAPAGGFGINDAVVQPFGVNDALVDAGPGFTTPFKAAARGVGEGTGAVISGIGTEMAGGHNQALTGFDAIDRGQAPDYGQMNPGAYNAVKDYAKATPEDRAKLRAAQQTLMGLGQHIQAGGQGVATGTQEAIPLTPGEQGSLVAKVPEMVGYGVPAIGAMVATRGKGAPTVLGTGAGVMAAQGADQGFQDAVAHGASLDDAYKAAYGSAQIQGGLGALPAGYVLDRLNAMTGGMVSRVLVGAATQAGSQGVISAVQQMMMNLQAKGLYDPQRGLGDNVTDTAVLGVLAGGMTGGALGVLPGAKPGKGPPPPPPPPGSAETPAGAAPPPPAPPAAPLPDHLMPGAGDVVGLNTKGGAPQRVTVSSVQGGHVFFTDEAGVTRGTTVADFSRDLTAAPEPKIDTSVISAASPDRFRVSDVPPAVSKTGEPSHVTEGPPLESYGDVFGRDDVEVPQAHEVTPAAGSGFQDPHMEADFNRLVNAPAAEAAPETIRLYRGEGGKQMGSSEGGNWWTTDLNKAQRFAEDGGRVVVMDVPKQAEYLKGFIQGHGGPDEFLTEPSWMGRLKSSGIEPRPLTDIAQERAPNVLTDRTAEPVRPTGAAEVLPPNASGGRLPGGAAPGVAERPVVAGDNEGASALEQAGLEPGYFQKLKDEHTRISREAGYPDEDKLWQLPREDIDALAQRVKDQGENTERQIYGDDYNKVQSLYRKANSSWDISGADKAQAELDAYHEALSPEKKAMLDQYERSNPGPHPDSVKVVQDAMRDTEWTPDEPIENIARETAYGIMKVTDPNKILDVPKGGASVEAQAAYIRVNRGIKAMRDRSVPAADIANRLVRGLEDHGFKHDDAGDFVHDFLTESRERFGGAKKIGDDISVNAEKGSHEPEVFDNKTEELKSAMERGAKPQEWMLANGRKSGNEYTVAMRPDGSLAMAGTSHEKGGVRFPLDALDDLDKPGANLRLEHNHPIDAAMSDNDLASLAWPGASMQVAYSHGGQVSAAALSKAIAAYRDANGRVATGRFLSGLYDQTYSHMLRYVDPIKAQELTMRVLGDGGIVEYYSSHNITQQEAALVKKASDHLLGAMQYGRLQNVAQDVASGVHRPTTSGRTSEVLGALSQRHAEVAAGQRPGTEGAGAGSGGAEGGDQTTKKGIIEQRNSPPVRPGEPVVPGREDVPVVDAIRTPDGRPATASEIAAEASRLAKMPKDSTLGKLRKISSYATLPVSLASKDRLSANLFGAVMDRFRRLNALENEAVPQASPYFKLKQAAMSRVNQIMEVTRLYGMDLPDDGRSIVLQVPEQRTPFGSPRPELSRPGQVLALSPEETAAYHSLKGFFQNRLTQMGEALARSRGYEGDFTREAIQAQIDAIRNGPVPKRLTRALHAFEMTEEMRRAGYVPFNRYGDYFVKVRAIDPASGDQGGLWFVPKQSIFQDVQVKMDRSNEQIPVREKVAELRSQYPADRFHIETGKTEALGGKNVLMQANIPQLEKIFMMLDRPGTDASAAILDDLMDKLFEARKAGFRKQAQNVRGYSTDFERAIADYIRQSSAHVSNMEHRNSIDTARTAIDDHPDKNIRSFWDNYMRDLDTPDGIASQALRKVGFFQFIWGSFASAATNILQTPGVTLPALAAWAGPRAPVLLGEAMTEAANAITVGNRGFTIDWSKIGRTDVERAAIQRARNEGVMDPRMAEEAQGKNVSSSQRLRPYAKRMGHVWDAGGSMFSTAESINRIAAWLSHFRAAQNPQLVENFARAHAQDQNFQRMRRNGGLTPENIARFGVEDTQFIGGKVNRAPITRGPGAWLLQFKPYLLNYLRIFNRMATRMGWRGKMAFSLGMGALVAQSGLFGLPYGQDVTDLGEWIYKQMTGIDPMIETRIKQTADDSALGPLGGELVGHGLGRLGPVDISGRTSMGNIVPNGSPLDLFPLASGTVGRLLQFVNEMKQGRPWTAWASASGALIGKGGEDIAKAAALAKEGYATQKGNVVEFPSQVTKTQIAARALGFQPSDLSRELEQRAEANRMKESTTAASSKLLTDVSRELALAQDATRHGNKAEAAQHYARYTALIKGNAAQLADPSIPGWEKLPPVQLRAIKAAIRQQIDYNNSVLSRTSKLKRGAVQSIQGAP